MKIIGGHDYYDGAGYGVDETIVFVRKEVEFQDTPFSLPSPTHRYEWNGSVFSYHLILVAGKAYPAFREVRSVKNKYYGWNDTKIEWHYDVKSAKSALRRTTTSKEAAHRYRYSLMRCEETITRHFREDERKDWTDWMIENRVITGLVSNNERSLAEDGTSVRANIADLKELEFYRRLDPATIHMEISNFIGGVLPHGTETIELSDKDKIRKAGFDTQISFRQDPGVKKPRRRRKN